ncbi:MAG: ATP-binding protein [Anaerolineales bacterium]
MLPDFRIRQRDYLLETTRALTEELDLKKVLARIVHIAAELLAGRASLIALRQDGRWTIASSYGIRPDFLKRVQRLLEDIPSQPDSTRFELPEVTSRLQRITETASMGLLSSVGLPLVARSEVIGVIFIFRAYHGSFSSQDREVLQAFASQAAIAVHNARLYTEIAEQKQHLDAVVDSAADGIFILDDKFRFSRFNRACSTMTGYQEQAVLGEKHDRVIQFAKLEAGSPLEEEHERGWPNREPTTLYVEGDLEKRDGGTISVGVTYAPVFSEDQNLLSVVGNVRDVTRFREAEELKDTFISIVSHELRTPVALIKGYVGTLRREDAEWDPDVIRDSLEVIEEESDHLARMIDDLLDASRLQADALVLNLGEVALDDITGRIVERFSTQSDGHSFEVEFPETFPPIRADEARLTQVISNLLSNAIKFSRDGGNIAIQGRVDNQDVILCVQDQGPGIAAHEAAHVFDRFYRSRSTANKAPGTGLGLYLSRAVVEAHGGRIWVDESVTKGARICFCLPIHPQDLRKA